MAESDLTKPRFWHQEKSRSEIEISVLSKSHFCQIFVKNLGFVKSQIAILHNVKISIWLPKSQYFFYIYILLMTKLIW